MLRADRKRLTEQGWWKPSRSSVTFRSSPEVSSRLDCLRHQFAPHKCAFQKHTAASQINSDEKSMAVKAWLRVDALKRKGGFHFISVRQRMCLLGAVFLHSFARVRVGRFSEALAASTVFAVFNRMEEKKTPTHFEKINRGTNLAQTIASVTV